MTHNSQSIQRLAHYVRRIHDSQQYLAVFLPHSGNIPVMTVCRVLNGYYMLAVCLSPYFIQHYHCLADADMVLERLNEVVEITDITDHCRYEIRESNLARSYPFMHELIYN